MTYTKVNRIGFYQPSAAPITGPTRDGRNDVISPYTIIALSRAGSQILTFSEAIANPICAFVSLNGPPKGTAKGTD